MGKDELEAFDSDTARLISHRSPSTGEGPVYQQPNRDLRNAIWAIVTGVALPCIPIIAFSILLLNIIFHHRVDASHSHPELGMTTIAAHEHPANFTEWLYDLRHYGPAYLVAYNPCTITVIASWTSRLIPYLSSSIMALVAFFAARHIVQQSKRGAEADLPTPEQLTLLIGLLAGSGIEPLKDALSFRWIKKERLVSPVPAAFWVLALITTLAILIPATDSWMGIATRAIKITTYSSTTHHRNFGRRLNTHGVDSLCSKGPSAAVTVPKFETASKSFWPCNLAVDTTSEARVEVINSTEASRLQFGLATSTKIRNFNASSGNWYYYFDPQSSDSIDYKTSAPAISTQCTPITKKCTSKESSAGTFVCSPGFQVDVGKSWPYNLYNSSAANATDSTTGAFDVGISFSADRQLSSIPPLLHRNDGPESPKIVPQNPAYFGTWAKGYPSASTASPLLKETDGQIFITSEDTIWFLNCTTMVANATFTFVNNNIDTFHPTLTSPEMAALFTGQFSMLGFNKDLLSAMENVARIAGTTSTTMTELADTWASQFSKTAMALTVGAFEPLTNEIEQERGSIVVARVPIIPLFILLTLKLIYVLMVIILAIGAYAFTHPAETEVVKAQLSAKGLAAAHFDKPELLQQNAVRAVQSRLDLVRTKTRYVSPMTANVTEDATVTKQIERDFDDDDDDEDEEKRHPPPVPGVLRRTTTSPADLAGGKARVGLKPDSTGTWRFVLLAGGAWNLIEPVVSTFVGNAAGMGELGAAGDLINAWKKKTPNVGGTPVAGYQW